MPIGFKSILFLSVILLIGLIAAWIWLSQLPLNTPQTSSPEVSTLTYTALGDSITVGLGGQPGFVDILSTKLGQPGRVITYNFGQSGAKLNDVTSQISSSSEIQSQLNQSDIISLTIGGNDLLEAVRKLQLPECREALEICISSDVEQYQLNWNQLAQTLSAHINPNSTVIITTIYHLDPDNPPLDISISEEELHLIDENLTQSNNTIQAIADQYGWNTAKIDEKFSEHSPPPISQDGIHPDATGHQIIADSIYQTWQNHSAKSTQ